MKIYTPVFFLLMMCMPFLNAMGDEIALLNNGHIVHYPIESSYPKGVTVSVDEGVVRIQNDNATPQSVQLIGIQFHMPLMKEKTTLWYRAEIRSDAGTTSACLESTTYTLSGQSYFSRALHQIVVNETDWHTSQTPFFLEKDDYSAGLVLGVYFQGPGTVYLRNLEYSKVAGHSKTTPLGAMLGMAGALFGVLVGIWGGLAGVLVSKGKAKKFIVTSAVLFVLFGVLCILAGLFFLVSGAARDLCYGLLLPGFIGTCVVGALIPVLMRSYGQHESLRLKRMDQADSL